MSKDYRLSSKDYRLKIKNETHRQRIQTLLMGYQQ